MPDTAAIIGDWQARFEDILPGYLPDSSQTPAIAATEPFGFNGYSITGAW